MSLFQLVRAAEAAENETGTGAEVDLQEQVDVAITVADESAEIQQEVDQAAVEVASIEDAVQEGEALEEHAEVVADAIESGEGISPEHAETLSIAMESIRNRLGLADGERLVPAAESFGTADGRIYQTKLVGESIKDTIRKIWQGIKAMAARVWDRIKLLIAKITGSTGMLVKQVAALKERARKMPSGAKPKEKNIKSGVAREIGIKEKANLDTFNKIFENTTALAGVGKIAADNSKAVMTSVSDLAGKEITADAVKAFYSKKSVASKSMTSSLSAMLKDVSGVFGASALNALVKGKKPKAGSTETQVHYGPFVGSTVLTVRTETGGDDVEVELSFGAVPGKTATEVTALSLNEVKTVLNDTEKLVAQLNDFKRVQADYEAVTKSIQNVSDTVIRSAESILDKTGSTTEVRTGLQAMKTSVSDTISTLNMVGARAPSMIHRLCRAGINYASLSLSNLREG